MESDDGPFPLLYCLNSQLRTGFNSEVSLAHLAVVRCGHILFYRSLPHSPYKELAGKGLIRMSAMFAVLLSVGRCAPSTFRGAYFQQISVDLIMQPQQFHLRVTSCSLILKICLMWASKMSVLLWNRSPSCGAMCLQTVSRMFRIRECPHWRLGVWVSGQQL
ncbi:hypothetical protein T05_4668 [Trichinella murrelli]|uniref:Uncharacterized protein n=1 Tax=Trichinella murrelli TaxID=144512 RepID=A0A0V0TWB3_9BILA|nr:hypothetical protein T05_4668 [Trichinella murrelli]